MLAPHRRALRALTPLLVGDPDHGIFSASTGFSRPRVQRVFETAVTGATDAPTAPLAGALGRLLYLAHLAVLLWWLLDRSPQQRATRTLVSLIERAVPASALALRLPAGRRFVLRLDQLVRDALVAAAA